MISNILTIFFVSLLHSDSFVDSGIVYVESVEDFVNPDRGFYQPLQFKLGRDNTQSPWWMSVNELKKYIKQYGLIHLRVGLEAFSTNAGGTDGPITNSALTFLNTLFSYLRTAGGTSIARFSYDVDGTYNNNEPDMTLIESHIQQLGTLISQNLDVVAAVETGILGPWGEQHSTKLAQSGAHTFFVLVEAWLHSVPGSRTVSVRRPLFYTYWANEKYGTNFAPGNISSGGAHNAVYGDGENTGGYTDAYRVGVFNDGYLGSSSDLGTFTNRGEEVAWLELQAAHTLYGGEVAASSTGGTIGEYNSIEYIANEGFRTHTSYLNHEWNDAVIGRWKATPYPGPDTVYRAAATTAYTYVAAHLGFRFVLRESVLTAGAVPNGGLLQLQGKIENVGFGNVVNEKKTFILLVRRKEDEGNEIGTGTGEGGCAAALYGTEIVGLDFRLLLSTHTETYTIGLRLPAAMPGGKYGVYLQVGDSEEKAEAVAGAGTGAGVVGALGGALRKIRFANAGVWDAALGANLLGEVRVEGREEEEGEGEGDCETATAVVVESCIAWSECSSSSSSSGSESKPKTDTNGSFGEMNTLPSKMRNFLLFLTIVVMLFL